MFYVRKHPKPERDKISEVILRSYRELLFKWFINILGLILLNRVLGLTVKSFINIIF